MQSFLIESSYIYHANLLIQEKNERKKFSKSMNLNTFPIFQDYCVVQLILLFKNIVQQNLYHFYTSSLLQTCLSHCVGEQRWSYQILVFHFLINI